MDTQLQLLEQITKYLLSIQTVTPVIFGIINSIAMLFRGVTGQGPTILECADIIERNIDVNDTKIRGEITRLKAELGVSP